MMSNEENMGNLVEEGARKEKKEGMKRGSRVLRKLQQLSLQRPRYMQLVDSNGRGELNIFAASLLMQRILILTQLYLPSLLN